jgi:hypothetical protein
LWLLQLSFKVWLCVRLILDGLVIGVGTDDPVILGLGVFVIRDQFRQD